jgi:hypothetical protein
MNPATLPICPPVPQYVAALTLANGRTKRSIPLPDAETADRIGKWSLLDLEVKSYTVEEVQPAAGQGNQLANLAC